MNLFDTGPCKVQQLLVLQERSKGIMFKKVSWLSFSECLY